MTWVKDFKPGGGAGWWWHTPLMALQSDFQDSQGYTEKPCIKKPTHTHTHTQNQPQWWK
jgi:hypothetical protein